MLCWRTDASPVFDPTRITAREATGDFAGLLHCVAAGQRVDITRGGQVIAVLAPPYDPPDVNLRRQRLL